MYINTIWRKIFEQQKIVPFFLVAHIFAGFFFDWIVSRLRLIAARLERKIEIFTFYLYKSSAHGVVSKQNAKALQLDAIFFHPLWPNALAPGNISPVQVSLGLV